MKTIMLKKDASMLTGGLTQTSKMPCKSYSLPTEACDTGFKMSKIEGSVCFFCYANNGFYKLYEKTIKPAQFARLDSLTSPYWVDAMVALIGSDAYFRWHDAGDLQGLAHFKKIVEVCELTPNTKHWLPTREYSIIKAFISAGGVIPKNQENLMYLFSVIVKQKKILKELFTNHLTNIIVLLETTTYIPVL